MSLELEKARAHERGDEKANAFTGATRSVEVSTLQKGDRFKFPKAGEYEVYTSHIGENTAEYIFVELIGGRPGVIVQFYPSTFTKARQRYNENGIPVPGDRPHCKGTAAEEFRKYVTVNEGMNALGEREVEVTDMEPVRTLRYGTTSLMTTYIPTIDFVVEEQQNQEGNPEDK